MLFEMKMMGLRERRESHTVFFFWRPSPSTERLLSRIYAGYDSEKNDVLAPIPVDHDARVAAWLDQSDAVLPRKSPFILTDSLT